MHILWLRNDLRVRDNPALAASLAAARASTEPLLALYMSSAADRQRFPIADIKLDFIARNITVLRKDLAALHVPLVVLKVADDDAIQAALSAIFDASGATQLRFNNEYPWYERERDKAITRALRERDSSKAGGVKVERFDDRVIMAPASLRTGAGQPYRVFTPYKRAWLKRLQDEPVESLPIPQPLATGLSDVDAAALIDKALAAINPARIKRCQCPDDLAPDDLAIGQVVGADLWPAGEAEAQRRLADFLAGPILDYTQARDIPARAGTSTLSPYLAIGAISPRDILQQLTDHFGPIGQWENGPLTWLSELIWREFYQHLIVDFPALSRGQPMQRDTIFIPWRGANTDFDAWCAGRTGFPIIDAAMLQLRQTGWMHNRLRMLTASFLCKNLQVDWRLGEQFFMQHLIDGDFAANNGGWQWSASTGADAAPYFRVFNPVTQSRKFDPDGDFLLQYLPQLAALPPKLRHDPQGENYHPPLVDLGESRAASIAAFAASRQFTRE